MWRGGSPAIVVLVLVPSISSDSAEAVALHGGDVAFKLDIQVVCMCLIWCTIHGNQTAFAVGERDDDGRFEIKERRTS